MAFSIKLYNYTEDDLKIKYIIVSNIWDQVSIQFLGTSSPKVCLKAMKTIRCDREHGTWMQISEQILPLSYDNTRGLQNFNPCLIKKHKIQFWILPISFSYLSFEWQIYSKAWNNNLNSLTILSTAHTLPSSSKICFEFVKDIYLI